MPLAALTEAQWDQMLDSFYTVKMGINYLDDPSVAVQTKVC